MSSFVQSTSNPSSPPAITVRVTWFSRVAKKKHNEMRTILMHAAAIAWEQNQSTVIRIRSAMHDTTNSVVPGTDIEVLIPDPDGNHYTAEIQNNNTGMWRTWHHYFELSNGTWVLNTQVSPNPVFYNPHGLSNANVIPNQTQRTDRVMIYKHNNVYYYKIL